MSTDIPARRGSRLYQNLDVSSEARIPEDGASLVFNAARGLWVPHKFSEFTLSDKIVTEPKLDDLSVSTRTIQAAAVTQTQLALLSVGTGQLQDNAATDAKVGNRTVDDGVAVTTSTAENTGTLTQLLSRITSRIRQIIGGTSWRAAVPISLTELASHRTRHYTGGADPITPANIGAAASSHSHSDATQAVAGFMSAADKLKLDQSGHHWKATRTGDLLLTGTFQFVTGMQVLLDRTGTWLIIINATFKYNSSVSRSAGWTVETQLEVAGTPILTSYEGAPTSSLYPVTLVGITAQDRTSQAYVDLMVRERFDSGGTYLDYAQLIAIYIG